MRNSIFAIFFLLATQFQMIGQTSSIKIFTMVYLSAIGFGWIGLKIKILYLLFLSKYSRSSSQL